MDYKHDTIIPDIIAHGYHIYIDIVSSWDYRVKR